MTAPDDGARFEVVVEVNELHSYDREPMVSLVREESHGKLLRGELRCLVNVAHLTCTREQARWFGRRLYRKIRVTFEDIGEVSAEELAAFEDEDGHLHKHQDNLEFAKGLEKKGNGRQLSLTDDDELEP